MFKVKHALFQTNKVTGRQHTISTATNHHYGNSKTSVFTNVCHFLRTVIKSLPRLSEFNGGRRMRIGAKNCTILCVTTGTV